MGFSRYYLPFAALVIVMMMLACSIGAPATEAPLDQLPPTLTTALTIPDDTPEPPIDSAPAPVVIPDMPLSLNGPWLVFANELGIWAVNPDGSGLQQLTDQPIATGHDLAEGIPFNGRQVAYITATGFDKDLTLHVVALPQGSEIFSTPLISDAVYAQQDSSFVPEAVKAAGSLDITDWSRDGRFLAFMAALDGPTLDLYLYDILSGEVIRLTDGPSEGIDPSWSPTGDYVFHLGIDSVGTGAGMAMTGAWVARPDDSEVRSVYDPEDSGDEVIVGWIDDITLVMHSWDPRCGAKNLRTLDVQKDSPGVLWEGYFSEAALDPFSGTLTVSVPVFQRDCNADDQQGIFIVSRNIPARQIIDDEPKEVVWSPEAQHFFSRTELGSQVISLNGEWQAIAEIPGNFPPIVSAGGEQLAWYGSEKLWVGPLANSVENPPQKVFNEAVTHATWNPSGDGLFIFSGTTLWFAPSPEFIPTLVAEGASTFQSAWLAP